MQLGIQPVERGFNSVALGEAAHPHVVCRGCIFLLTHAGSGSRSCYFASRLFSGCLDPVKAAAIPEVYENPPG